MLSRTVAIHWELLDIMLCFADFGFESILSVILDSFNVWLLYNGVMNMMVHFYEAASELVFHDFAIVFC